MKTAITLISLLALPLMASAQTFHLNMDGSDAGLTVSGVHQAEYVDGAVGKALRTDGYSTYATATIDASKLSNNTFSFSLWCAPETYPVMNANEAENTPTFTVIAGNIDDNAKTGFAFEISSQGDYRFRCYANGWKSTCTAKGKMPRDKWSHLVATRSRRRLYLYNNGVEVARVNMGSNLSVGSNTLYFGKSQKDIKLDDFCLNTFNGLIDDFAAYNTALTASQMQGTDVAPDFTVPASRFAGDIYRPVFHGMPQANWTNESHGFTFYNGQYHLFFQKNANGPYMARLHWGHLTTTDLLHWTEQPIALTPDTTYDIKGCWSGSLMTVNGVPDIIYTGVDNAKARIALAEPLDNNLINWKKTGVIIDGRPEGLSDDFRDPYYFEANGNKYIVVGTSKNGVGALTLHKYNNGLWTNDGTMFYQGTNTTVAGTLWEMPTVTKIGDKWLVTVTPQNTSEGVKTLYWTGTIGSDGKFVADSDTPKQLELFSKDGYGLLSPSITQHNGKTLLMGIVPDKVESSVNYNLGWAHCYSLPREISLADDGTLIQKPAIDICNSASATTLEVNGSQKINGVSGRQWEVTGEFTVGSSDFGFNFLKDGDRMGKITYSPSNNKLTVDLTQLDRIVNDNGSYNGIYEAYVPQTNLSPSLRGKYGEKPFKLTVFFDHSILDVFINDTYAFSMRVFATAANGDDVEVFADAPTNVKLTTSSTSTGIDNSKFITQSSKFQVQSSKFQVFDLQGRRANNASRGLLFVRDNGKSYKIVKD